MNALELADEVENVIKECRQRVLKEGHDQYYDPSTGLNLFETMPVDDLFEYAEEELRDLVVYAVMLRIRLRRLRGAVDRRLTPWIQQEPTAEQLREVYDRAVWSMSIDEPPTSMMRTDDGDDIGHTEPYPAEA